MQWTSQYQEQDENDDALYGITRNAAGEVVTVGGHTAGYWTEKMNDERYYIRQYETEIRYAITSKRGRALEEAQEELRARIEACRWNINEFSAYVEMFSNGG